MTSGTPERFLVDTNIFISLFNGQLAVDLPQAELGCSIITEMELRSFPQLTAEEEQLIRERLTRLTIYGIDDAIKEEAIRLRRTARLKLPDALIAATAIVHQAILLTNDQQIQTTPGLECQALPLKTEV